MLGLAITSVFSVSLYISYHLFFLFLSTFHTVCFFCFSLHFIPSVFSVSVYISYHLFFSVSLYISYRLFFLFLSTFHTVCFFCFSLHSLLWVLFLSLFLSVSYSIFSIDNMEMECHDMKWYNCIINNLPLWTKSNILPCRLTCLITPHLVETILLCLTSLRMAIVWASSVNVI